MTEQKMKVEVWTDIMCPYCYIGKKHYEKALAQFDHADEIELEWKLINSTPICRVMDMEFRYRNI